MRSMKSLNSALANLGQWSTTSRSGTPSAERGAISSMTRAASAAVSVERVGTAWTLLEKCQACTCTWSMPAAVIGRPSSDNAAPARGKREGMGQAARARVVGLGALADLTGPHVGDDVARLPRPVGEPADVGTGQPSCGGQRVHRGAWHSCRIRALIPPHQAHTADRHPPAPGGRASRSE